MKAETILYVFLIIVFLALTRYSAITIIIPITFAILYSFIDFINKKNY
jgi:hypothetical protein